MNRKTFAALLVSMTTITISTRGYGGDCCDDGRGHGWFTCPRCNACCDLKVEGAKEEKHCWNIECKEICIPKIVFPWQKSCCNPCENNGAHVKTVKVLKKHTFECPTCKYTWTPHKLGCCGNGADGCCGGCTGDVIKESPVETPVPVPAVDPAGRFDPQASTSATSSETTKESQHLVPGRYLVAELRSRKLRFPARSNWTNRHPEDKTVVVQVNPASFTARADITRERTVARAVVDSTSDERANPRLRGLFK